MFRQIKTTFKDGREVSTVQVASVNNVSHFETVVFAKQGGIIGNVVATYSPEEAAAKHTEITMQIVCERLQAE